MRRLPVLVLVLMLVAGCGGSGGASDEAAPATLGPLELVEALREGGYVVYLRHAATDPGDKDTNKTDVASCVGMRNLVERGREQARAIGRAFRALDIPVSEVRASAYCRTRETAELAFGRFTRDHVLTGFPDPGTPAYVERLAATRALLGRRPPDGTNVVLVSHIKNIEAAAGIEIEEGELAVFEPESGNRFRYRGRIPASAWPHLAEELTRGP